MSLKELDADMVQLCYERSFNPCCNGMSLKGSQDGTFGSEDYAF